MGNSFFRNAFDRVVAARKRQADMLINETLLRYDDQTLKSIGTSRAELLRNRF
ncbi:hypothetical protein ACQKKX_04120 [Neorhizobium sp. NPDC001467]|uniref:hypothetical protein n=1 Tax=Neorhizobium sp. NPDC001467 TaxID=3390595 RepID=UPI003D078DF3